MSLSVVDKFDDGRGSRALELRSFARATGRPLLVTLGQNLLAQLSVLQDRKLLATLIFLLLQHWQAFDRVTPGMVS